MFNSLRRQMRAKIDFAPPAAARRGGQWIDPALEVSQSLLLTAAQSGAHGV
jgi:hypothetical protein